MTSEIAVVDGTRHLVRVLSFQLPRVNIKFITDGTGRALTQDEEWTESHDISVIVTYLPIQILPQLPVTIYHFTQRNQHIPRASEYVADHTGEPFASTTNHGLGSGVYGLFFNDERIAQLYKQPDQQIIPIQCYNPYYLQNSKHGESLTRASKELDRLADDKLNNKEVLINGLVMLWNLVFYQSHRRTPVTSELLDEVINEAVSNRLQSLNPVVSPIVILMKALGYDSIVATDPYNNNWSRGCVAFLPIQGYNPIITTRRQRLFLG